MPSASDLLRLKSGDLYTIEPTATVLAATRVMNTHHVGALLVMSADRLDGIFTERDVLTRVVAQGRDPSATLTSEVMTTDLFCCEPATDLDEIAEVMRKRRIRHVPVRRPDGQVMGVISIGDVNAFHVSSKQATIDGLCGYITQRA